MTNTATFANADIKHESRQILWKAIHSSEISESTKLLLPATSIHLQKTVYNILALSGTIQSSISYIACEASVSMAFLCVFRCLTMQKLGWEQKMHKNPQKRFQHRQFLTDCEACLWSPFEVFIFLIAALWNARSNSDPKSLGENPSVFFTNELNWE